MSRTLRYQISDWNQVTECLSNNSKNLFLSLSKYIDLDTFRGLVIQVNHANYGTLFAALIKGTGVLVSDYDDDGNELPFMTTQEILKQLAKFGFFITYDEKSNLPPATITYLTKMLDLGYDKVNRIYVQSEDRRSWQTTNIVMKSYMKNDDLLSFGCKVSRKIYNDKLNANSIVNCTKEDDLHWDWLNYIANISDLLDENIDPRDEFETGTDIKTKDPQDAYPVIPEGFTPYDYTEGQQKHAQEEQASTVPDNFTVYDGGNDDGAE